MEIQVFSKNRYKDEGTEPPSSAEYGHLQPTPRHQSSSIVELISQDEVITIAREALKATPDDYPHQAILLNNLGTRLSNRYSRTGSIEDLEESITIIREALKATPDDHPDRARPLNNLGLQLGDRYSRTGAMADLEESITITREALKATPDDDLDRAISLNNLGVRLGDRYSRTDRAGRLNSLGNRLGNRYWRTGSTEDLEESITITREAVNATPEDHPHRAILLNSLGNRLGNRYWRTGSTEDLEDLGNRLGNRYWRTGSTEDLEESITITREALKATPDDHPDRARPLNNLGLQLGDRYLRTESMTDLEESITVTREAVNATPEDHPNRAGELNNLGLGLRNRYSRTGAMADLEEMKICTISERIRAGRSLLSLPNIFQDIQGAYAVAEIAVNLIPLLSSFSLHSADKQYQLRQAVGMASVAAAVALHAGQGPIAALELLETGRGVLAGSLQNIRTDLSALQQRHPDLAHNYRYKAGADLDSLIQNIRGHPGFERFLLSATEEEMRNAAVYGPIVIINVSSHRCDALIVKRSGVHVIDLPQLTQASLEERPVLDELGFIAPPAGDTWPHVWWIPTGPLTRFPIHAAGHHTKNSTETVLDRVVSSYSSSIRSIIHTHQQRLLETSATLDLKVVLVDIEETPSQSRLCHAKVETEAVEEVYNSIGLPCNQPPAYKKDVLAVLGSYQILHFAGHGVTRPDPLQSLLLLKDWENNPLTVESLLDTNLSSTPPFLAYLSACGTSRIQDDHVVDESIHLTSAFQLAGFRHVIGTLWEVDDAVCVDIARMAYRFMGEKVFSDESVSYGLHHAMRKLRDQWIKIENVKVANRDRVLITGMAQDAPTWVPYVHYGV
ncbi:hypothetical protein LX36DRAFT_729603 [Colletotrichum falcatum]|nr:hypothetical protein LX36DRAFT_729603 [Colletotrichum falcatum]